MRLAKSFILASYALGPYVRLTTRHVGINCVPQDPPALISEVALTMQQVLSGPGCNDEQYLQGALLGYWPARGGIC